MIKVKKDQALQSSETFNSLEIVTTSSRPHRNYFSKYLIALLSYGGVPQEFFLNLLINALDETKNVFTKRLAALRVASFNDGLDWGFLAQRMICCGVPLNEPYLQVCLSNLARSEKTKLKQGNIPVSESFYLMGTADPTGVLNNDQVCVILDSGQISGKVLVYRNPGMHFGDIHIMEAVYIKQLEDFVGNAKYGIFFSTKGQSSAAYEMATGDFDGDMYWVSRNPEIEVPIYLRAEKFPHHMERVDECSYNSSSILGRIYDRVLAFHNEADPRIEIWKLPCFDISIPEIYVSNWRCRYSSYRREMVEALNSADETKSDAADEVIKKYKQILYDAPDMEESAKNTQVIYEEAVAIYHVTYDYATQHGVEKCGFAWKVAGSALCNLYAWKLADRTEKPVTILPSILRDLLN